VGLDSVVNLFGGPNANPSTGAIPSSGVAPGLSASAPTASTAATSRLHWYFMDSTSNELANSAFPVSADDVIEFNSAYMPTMTFSSSSPPTPGNLNNALPAKTGYLVIVNESAINGGAPLFSFQADAFISGTGNTPAVGFVSNIPVYPLSDAADAGAGAPSLNNNVLENVAGVPAGAAYGAGPIVSPLISGIRLGAADASGNTQAWFRVIDFPVNGNSGGVTSPTSPTPGETYVIWSDRNSSTNIVNGAIVTTPAINGSTLTYDCNENNVSGPSLSVTRQLSVLTLGTPAQTYTNLTANNATVDGYSALSATLGATGSNNCYSNTAANVLPQGGFLRWFAQANPYNYGGLTAAAYQAGVVFRLRNSTTDGYSQLPVDRGFFTAR
jgi:hypothetical protein